MTGYVDNTIVLSFFDGPFQLETRYIENIGNGQTRMTLRNTGQSSVFSMFVVPFMMMAMRRANRKA